MDKPSGATTSSRLLGGVILGLNSLLLRHLRGVLGLWIGRRPVVVSAEHGTQKMLLLFEGASRQRQPARQRRAETGLLGVAVMCPSPLAPALRPGWPRRRQCPWRRGASPRPSPWCPPPVPEEENGRSVKPVSAARPQQSGCGKAYRPTAAAGRTLAEGSTGSGGKRRRRAAAVGLWGGGIWRAFWAT